jgi:hypothetical protein
MATRMGTIAMREIRKRIPHRGSGRAHQLESLCDRASVLSNKNAAMRQASSWSFSCFICLNHKRACAQDACYRHDFCRPTHHVQCLFVVPLRPDFFGEVGRVLGVVGLRDACFTLDSSFALHGATCCFATAGATNLGDLRMPPEALTFCFLATEVCFLGFPVPSSAIAFVLRGLVAEACLKGVGARTSGTTPDFKALLRVLRLSGRVFA